MKRLLLCVTSAFLCSVAYGHGNKLDMTGASIAQALKQFQKDHPDHVSHFQGVKGWPEEDKIKVKIYMPESASMQYTCFHEDAGNTNVIKCTMEM